MCRLQHLDYFLRDMLFVVIVQLVAAGIKHYTVTGCAHNDVVISKHSAHNAANVFLSLSPCINLQIPIRGHTNDTGKQIGNGLLHYI